MLRSSALSKTLYIQPHHKHTTHRERLQNSSLEPDAMSKSVFGRRRNLTCFFCGHRTSVVTSEPYVKQFTCTSAYCQSVNNLDESGNIVDYIPSPQPHVPPPAPRYGRSVRSPSPQLEDPSVGSGGGGGGDSPVFCRTCQKHLSIKHNILADYLPPEDDPEFDVYWAKLPEFKRSLEEKYPEPCGPCALRANQRIKEANYLAKAAVIGRLLEQSQNMKPAYYMEPWGLSRMAKLVLWLLRGMGWVGIHFLVIIWHVTMLLYPIPLHDPVDITGTWGTCVSKSLGDKRVDIACYEASSLLAKSALPWSWICLFWNYQALACTRHQNAKLTGMEEFMKCELFLFLARLVAWLLLSPGRVRVDFSPDALKAWSFGFLALAVVGFLYSMTTLRITKPTPINLRESVSPLGSGSPNLKPRLRHYPNNTFLLQKEPRDTPLPPPRQPFFAPAATPQQPAGTFPSTSSFSRAKPKSRLDGSFSSHSISQPQSLNQYQRVSDDGADKMDWNPTSSPKIRLNTNWARTSTSNISSDVHSPFSIGIPQKPRTSMFEALVSGQTQQQQQQQQQQRQQLAPPLRDYFQANGRSRDRIGTPTTDMKYPPMAEPKFFPKNVAEGDDTGLEGLISGSLKLEDEPEVIRTARAQLIDHHDPWVEIIARLVMAIVACGLFAYFGVLVSNDSNEVVPHFVGPILAPYKEAAPSEMATRGKLASLALAGLCNFWKLMRRQNHTSQDQGWNFVRFIIASEGIAGVFLLIFTARTTDTETAEVLGKLYVGWLFAREMFNFISLLQRKGHSHSPVRKEEQEPPSRREVSPGLGEWPLPPELRSRPQQTLGARTVSAPGMGPAGTGRGRTILRRDGSSSLSISEGVSGFGGLKREGSSALAGMVRDASAVKAGNVPGMRRGGSGGFGNLRLS